MAKATKALPAFGGEPTGRRRRSVATPEGVIIGVDLADRGERALAAFLDLMFISLGYLAVILIGFFIATSNQNNKDAIAIALAIGLIALFLLKTFYFIFFEIRWRGRTPGKRIMGIQVVDRNGGALKAGAVFTRNLFRELELFIPATFLVTVNFRPSLAWEEICQMAWIGIFLLMPLFNRDSLRAGDMVAGTWVVSVPKVKLLPDLAAASATAKNQDAQTSSNRFTQRQLDVYGIHELQTLENILRNPGSDDDDRLSDIRTRIERKIEWVSAPGWSPQNREFLEAYYVELRKHLETKMLFGVKRRDKYDRS